MAESMRYVRAYPAELPALRDLLPHIQTAVQIIAGTRDQAVPPVNAEFLHHRLPHSKLDILDAGHFTWEDAADQYAALVTTRRLPGRQQQRATAACPALVKEPRTRRSSASPCQSWTWPNSTR